MDQTWAKIKDFLTSTKWGLPMWGIVGGVAVALYVYFGGKKKPSWKR